MRALILLISLCLIILNISAENELSPAAEISLLSCENGYELYNSYGHSAIRIHDPINQIDVIFNYGTFNDQVPNFLSRFIRGTVDYTLSASNFNIFLRSYEFENRTVIEQVLDLDSTEKQDIFNRIIINYETDEKYYRYDFFFDNCSSRIHEILKEVLGESLIYGKDLHENSPETFRDLIDPYMKHSPWAEFGVGLIMGYPTDRIATNKEKMFLPDHMRDRFDIATYKDKAFVKQTTILFQSTPTILTHNFLTNPILIMSIVSILIVMISLLGFKNNKHFYSIDYLLFLVTGIMGVFFLFMWIETRHSPTFQNMNMFWAMPLNLIALFFLKKKIIKPYLLFMFVLNIIGFFIFPQVFHWAILPIALMMAFRYYKLNSRII